MKARIAALLLTLSIVAGLLLSGPQADAQTTPTVTKFVLVNPTSNADIRELVAGGCVTNPFNIRTDVSGSVQSVRFGLDGNSNYRTENTAPYYLAGDDNGDVLPLTVAAGTHTVKATPYSADNAGGTAGVLKQVSFTVASTCSNPTPTPTPVPPTPTPIPPTPTPIPTGPSGQPMPVGDLPGWRQIFVEDWTTNAPVGSWVSTYESRWDRYLDGWTDTRGELYCPSSVLSVSGGVLQKYLHIENGRHCSAAILPRLFGPGTSGAMGKLYGKYTVRFKADSLNDYKTAWLLWPDSEQWPRDGEIDWPEGDLDGTMTAFMHHQGATSGSDQYVASTSATYTSWHTASTEWTPGRVRFLLDGVVIGETTERVPNTPMHWVIQTESCLGCTFNNINGNLYIDWIVFYEYVSS